MSLYFNIRTDALDALEQSNPNAAIAYERYRQAINRSKQAFNAQEAERYKREAREILTRFPLLSLTEASIRQQREQLRKQNPEMERVYQLFISTPGTVPTPSRTTPRIIRAS